ncbi:cation transporter [Roseospira visakhapatnamensis]|uniref:Co/Zn/Cd efflux system component n=1 Tax=Roseospira visakhapatnamensis TaxID=390880 RepID=A0A7W6RBN4_9PROT|nr:cation transporter [Roseospira visakhapatnamensis]MBB4264913.1 Co/Zn/Cd efflux system component [Roseospira visakhapatnamensis]
MAGCGCSQGVRFDGVSRRYRQVLLAVIAINASMFLVEMTSGMMAQSMALKADALDFLGDSLTYALSLAVIGMSLRVRATAALVKGISLAIMAVVVLGASLWRVLVAAQPDEVVMSSIGLLAFVANVASVLLLLRYRDGDSNVRSVWLCSRNDAIGNLGVIGAGLLVGLTGTRWPDLAVAAILAGLFLTSAVGIIRQARTERREAATDARVADRRPVAAE